MLRLDKLAISGFKSFCDRTELRVPTGITAIVGPNGCGKSNLGDAINWVLGSQSPRSMRGGRMGDLIFNGTRERKPQGMAEVSLHLHDAGDNGSPPRQLRITRRVYRSGDSDYELDGKRCRLKDIQGELADMGLGTGKTVIIAQGKVDQLVSAPPRDRRAILEEAAGLAGYKHKRRNAEAKLQASESNLSRVNDILSEVERQMRSLKRQAGRARRFRKIMDALRLRQLWLFAHRQRDLSARRETVDEELAARQEEQRRAAAAVDTETARTRELRASIEAADERIEGLQARGHELRRESDVRSDRLRTHRERIGELEHEAAEALAQAEALRSRAGELAERAGARDHDLDAATRALRELDERAQRADGTYRELREQADAHAARLEQLMHRRIEQVQRHSELRNRYSALVERLDKLRREQTRLERESERAAAEQNELEQSAAVHERRLEEARARSAELRDTVAAGRRERVRLEAELTAVERALRAVQEQRAVLRERLASLRRLDREDPGGGGEYLRSLVEQRNGDAPVELAGLLLDRIDVDPELERAAEAYLTPWLNAGVLGEEDSLVEAVEWLRQEGGGRFHLFRRRRNGHLPNAFARPLASELRADAEVVGRLSDGCRMPAPYAAALAEVAPDPVVVRSLPGAVRLAESHPDEQFLTVGGDVVLGSGWTRVAGTRASTGAIARHREASDLTVRLRALEHEEVRLGARRRALQALGAASRSRTEAAERELYEAERAELSTTVLLERTRDELGRKRQHVEVCEAERSELQGELRETEGSIRDAEEREQGQAAELGQHQEEVDATRRALDEKRAQAEQARQHALELGAELRSARQGREEVRIEVERAREAERQARLQIDELERAAQDRRGRVEALQDEVGTLVDELAKLGEKLDSAARELAAAESERADLRTAQEAAEAAVVECRERLERCREALGEVQVRRAQVLSDLEHLRESWTTETDRPVAELDAIELPAPDADPPPPPAAHDPERCAGELADLRERLDRLGPVNMMAIEEFDELEQRAEFLYGQRKDIVDAIESLRNTIRRINRTSRERFLEAYEAVRRNFRELYAELFEGGRAEIRLEEGEDVLEAGLEVVAQPPGKRLQSIHLLSGGEKALTALALLFAVFKFSPAPFCVLDEVDAPLDDANIDRFTRLLRHMSRHTQFLLVTHNRRSMEAADILYGVTMSEPGVSSLLSLKLN